MPGQGPVQIGIIGAGLISTEYLANLTQFEDVRVRFVADIDPERARSQAVQFGIPGYGSVDELLAIEDIEIVLNLTIPAAHVAIAERIFAAGKHMWAEKPFALDRASARHLLTIARARGVRLASAPDTFLGAGLQTAQRTLASGRIGTPLTALAIFSYPGPESWHPNPEFMFDHGAGPLLDLGPYYLTALVQMLGPITRVTAAESTARATRTIGSGPRKGTEFAVRVPTHHGALVTFASGASAQVVMSFESQVRRIVLEVNGSHGTLVLPDPNKFDGATELWSLGSASPEVIQAVGSVFGRGSGVAEFARAIRAGVSERASGELAFHVLDVMLSIISSAERGEPVDLASSAPAPAPVPEGWDPSARTL